MKMKNIYFIVFLFITTFNALAQRYGNEWVNFSQTYFKFPITKEGIYRIDSATLATKFNLQTLNPKNIQVFLKGKEQFIYIKGEADDKINMNDYIEFYANHYRREFDSLMYSDISYIPAPYTPLFNDTIFAYIGYNNSTNNKRYQVEVDTTIANYPIADYYYSELINNAVNGYNYVNDIQNKASDPRFTQAEGRGYDIVKGTTFSTSFGNLSLYVAATLPCYLQINYSGSSMNYVVPQDHQIITAYNDNLNNTVTLADSTFFAYTPVRQTYTLSNSTIGNTTSFSLQSVNNPSFSTFVNHTLFHALTFTYPKLPTLNGNLFNVLHVSDAISFPKQSFVLTNPNVGTTNTITAYDITNGKKLPVHVLTTDARMVVPNTGGMKKVVMCAESNVINVTNLLNVNQNQPFTNFKSSNLSNAYVILYHPNFITSAQAYKAYRESAPGGNYQVLMANINELYDQFGFGINKHPQAIRNFMKFLYDSLPTPPSYLFIVGKAVEFKSLNPGSQWTNLIPSMGSPSSDNLLTTGITNNHCLYPEIPVGRLAAVSNTDVTSYLTKVQQHESTGTVEWKKKVLHFVGGDEPNLAALLGTYMSLYEQIIEDTLVGADVYTFKKNTSAPIQTNISDSIKSAINSGSSLLTFFGHGSEIGFDQAIDNPNLYNNPGRYPFVFANSCYSGDIHIPGGRSVSENFVFANQKGSIGFLATTSTGYVSALYYFGTKFYHALTYSQYGKGIGDVIKEAIFNTTTTFDNVSIYTALDMTLHGDPALKIYDNASPDYVIQNNDVKFDTKQYVDSIGIIINFKNVSRAVNDSFFVKIERFFPNNDSVVFFKRVKAPHYKDSLRFYIPLDFVKGIGLNKFKVRLDQFNEINEITKTNNSTIGTVDLFIQGGDIVPVYPYKFAVVPLTSSITLKACTSDPFAASNRYILQLDTCDRFVNPVQQTHITSSGGVIEWNVTLPYQDSTVYFWRVSKDSITSNDKFIWRESSFQTIGTKVGWSQAHFNQFKTNTYRFVTYNKLLRRFDFNNNVQSLRVRNGMYPYIDPVNINLFFNNINASTWGCSPDGWNFAVFDSISGEPQPVVSINYPFLGPGTYSNCVCVDNQILYVYSFGLNNYCGFGNWQNDMNAFLNAIAPNNYVVGYTMGALGANYAQVQSYSNSLYTAFESIGSGSIRTTKDTVPIIIFGKKGMSAGQAREVIGTNKKQIIELEDSIRTRWHNGYIASEIIGPAYKWNSLHWQLKPFDAIAGDTTILKVVGIKSNGQIDTLGYFPKDSADVMALYNYANANTYPYLQLVAFMRDDVNRTSPQLRKWQVLYDQAPECAINPLKGFAAINDTLQEGDVVRFKIPIENIGKEVFKDSLVITYWIEDNNKIIHQLPQKVKRNLFAPGEIMMDTIALSSIQYVGNNAVWIDVNPPAHGKYQKEQEHFNNIARLLYKVNKDITNPLLDVTFDGARILNGDLVSAKPNILITLKDENKFLALNDTSSFNVSLRYPGQSIGESVYFANQLVFTPASLPNNSCKILYNPTLLNDGIYELSVQGKDKSLNRSAATEYKIQFEVKNKPSVTNVLNYPNPFSTSTKFVFTLTGSEIPEVFTIQIMTISGKVVKEITKDELGTLRIGRNITEYSWDGKDDFGDKLANGVYLYKVITRLNNTTVEKSATTADKFFVKDFGKMVIMR